jgi:predicted RNA-binding protein with TRAM domain
MNDMNRGGFRPRGFAPVKPGDLLNVKIEAVGEKGDGIAKVNGFVLFVPNTKEGQEVQVKVTRVLRKVGFAEVQGESTEPVGDEPAQEQSEEPQDSEDFGEETAEDSQDQSDDEEEPQEQSDDEDTEEPQGESDDSKQNL